jgi:hypothetical protein
MQLSFPMMHWADSLMEVDSIMLSRRQTMLLHSCCHGDAINRGGFRISYLKTRLGQLVEEMLFEEMLRLVS